MKIFLILIALSAKLIYASPEAKNTNITGILFINFTYL